MKFRSLIHQEAKRIEAKIRDIRRRIHQNPEPGYEEIETSGLVSGGLKALGVDFRSQIAGTGVLGRIDGREPGKGVALRADMDALRKEEAVGVSERPHRSRNPGIMHACGHDGHVAVLLGAAEILCRVKDRFRGTVKFIFQPAEEGGCGGSRMVDAGVLRDPDVGAVFALHAWPELPCGVIGIQHGTSMAASADFVIEVTGRSGHAAFPHQCIDPVPVAAQIITALQSIRSREVSPLVGSVVSVTILQTGTRTDPGAEPGEDELRPSQSNIIPAVVRMRGTSRALSLEGQEVQLKRIEEISRGIARAHRAGIGFGTGKEYPPTVHDRAMTDLGARVAREMLGRENAVWVEEPTMGGEDFSYYLQQVPGSFFRLGTARGKTPEARAMEPPLHSDRFDFNDDALVPGMVLMAGLALEYLK